MREGNLKSAIGNQQSQSAWESAIAIGNQQ
jgi:hypothetical protein